MDHGDMGETGKVLEIKIVAEPRFRRVNLQLQAPFFL